MTSPTAPHQPEVLLGADLLPGLVGDRPVSQLSSRPKPAPMQAATVAPSALAATARHAVNQPACGAGFRRSRSLARRAAVWCRCFRGWRRLGGLLEVVAFDRAAQRGMEHGEVVEVGPVKDTVVVDVVAVLGERSASSASRRPAMPGTCGRSVYAPRSACPPAVAAPNCEPAPIPDKSKPIRCSPGSAVDGRPIDCDGLTGPAHISIRALDRYSQRHADRIPG